MEQQDNSKRYHILALVAEIERIGFPNKRNISHLCSLTEELKTLAPQLSSTDQELIDLIAESIQGIEKKLQKGEQIALHHFAILNKRVILLQLSLDHVSL